MSTHRNRVTEHSVKYAIESLQREGKRVSVRNVRTQLGGGSHSTITPILRELRRISPTERPGETFGSLVLMGGGLRRVKAWIRRVLANVRDSSRA